MGLPEQKKQSHIFPIKELVCNCLVGSNNIKHRAEQLLLALGLKIQMEIVTVSRSGHGRHGVDITFQFD